MANRNTGLQDYLNKMEQEARAKAEEAQREVEKWRMRCEILREIHEAKFETNPSPEKKKKQGSGVSKYTVPDVVELDDVPATRNPRHSKQSHKVYPLRTPSPKRHQPRRMRSQSPSICSVSPEIPPAKHRAQPTPHSRRSSPVSKPKNRPSDSTSQPKTPKRPKTASSLRPNTEAKKSTVRARIAKGNMDSVDTRCSHCGNMFVGPKGLHAHQWRCINNPDRSSAKKGKNAEWENCWT